MADSFQSLEKIKRPFAENGSRRAIPDSVASTSNQASMQAGWNETTSTPIDEGGIPPNRLDFNQLGYLATSLLYFMQQGGFIQYDATISTNIGGYPKGAVLWVVDNGIPLYAVRSTVNNNTANPANDMTGWEKLTINPSGDAMSGTLTNVNTAQVRNIELVASEPTTGVDGTIYALVTQA
jgi:hypothetical protein